LGPRAGDGAELAIIELITEEPEKKSKSDGAKSKDKTGEEQSEAKDK